MLNHWQCLQTKLERQKTNPYFSERFVLNCYQCLQVKLESTTFGRPVSVYYHLQLSILKAGCSQGRLLRQRTRHKRSDKGIQGELDRTDFATRRPTLPLCTLYCQRELAKSKDTKHSFYKMIFHARARNVTVTALPSFLPHEP